jgi:hypothetical protein
VCCFSVGGIHKFSSVSRTCSVGLTRSVGDLTRLVVAVVFVRIYDVILSFVVELMYGYCRRIVAGDFRASLRCVFVLPRLRDVWRESRCRALFAC